MGAAERVERIVLFFTGGIVGFFLGFVFAIVLLGLRVALEHLG